MVQFHPCIQFHLCNFYFIHMNHIILCGHFHPYQFDQIEIFHQNHNLIYCFHPYGLMSCDEIHSHGLISSMKTKVQKLNDFGIFHL